MKLSVTDTVLWAASPLLNAALLGVLCLRARFRAFRVLTLWCAFSIATTAILFGVYRYASPHAYAVAYRWFDIADALLQLGVVLEVARIVAGPHSALPVRFRSRQAILVIVGVTVALLLVSSVNPAALTRTGVWEIRGELFTSLLISEMFAWVLVASQRLGLHWRSHVMSVGYGLMAWAVVTIAVGILHGYWGRSIHYTTVEHVRMVAYLAILSYWSVALWRDEPERELASPEMRTTLLQVAEQLRYDLAKVLPGREKERH